MTKHLIIITLFFASFLCFSQNYYTYYEGIKQAKLGLVADKLEASVTFYVETFEKFDFVFARDAYNAFEVAAILKDFEKMDYFARRCIKQGVAFELLVQDSTLSAFKTSDYWPKLNIDQDSLRAIYEAGINWELRNEINAMFAEDQEIRELAFKNRHNPFKIGKLKKQFEEIDYKLVLLLLEITKQYGFPGEKLIGLDESFMHPKINATDLCAGMPIVIFIHHFSQPNESYNSILIHEIETGHLYNEHYATISDFQHEYGKEKFGEIPCYSQKFLPKVAVDVIDDKRSAIGLIDLTNTYALQRKGYITPFWMRFK